MSLASSKILVDRAALLAESRRFFAERSVLEVDCGALRSHPQVDAHIEPVTTDSGYLHTSPEYGMKELLAHGIGDIYQLGPVYRRGETGAQHSVEFTMVEWYRLGFSLEQMLEETLSYLSLFLGMHPVKLHPFPHLSSDPTTQDLLLATEVEPTFRGECYHVMTPFPADRAALSQIMDGEAQRFEIYYEGRELANGYLELTDPAEYRVRLEQENSKRGEPLPLDLPFLESISGGLPPCCGVAVGFDRLMMLRHNLSHITQVKPGRTKALYSSDLSWL